MHSGARHHGFPVRIAPALCALCALCCTRCNPSSGARSIALAERPGCTLTLSFFGPAAAVVVTAAAPRRLPVEVTRLGGPTLEATPAPSAAEAPSPAAMPPPWPRNQAEMLLAQRWVPHAEEVEAQHAQQAQQAEHGARDAETGLSLEEAGKLGTIG